QRDVDVPRVQRLRQRPQRELQPGAQLIAVRRLLGKQREQDLLNDAQLVVPRRLLLRQARGFLHSDSSLTVSYEQVNRYLCACRGLSRSGPAPQESQPARRRTSRAISSTGRSSVSTRWSSTRSSSKCRAHHCAPARSPSGEAGSRRRIRSSSAECDAGRPTSLTAAPRIS